MRVHIAVLGCRLNEAEAAAWHYALTRAGHQLVTDPQQADVLVINTCAVTAEAARKSRKLASRIRRQNPAARLIVAGCLATMRPEASQELAEEGAVLVNAQKDALLAVIDTLEPTQRHVIEPTCTTEPRRTRAFVKVQDGCRHRCTFCIVTHLRGDERSVPLADVVDQVGALTDAGVSDVCLCGVHLGAYGRSGAEALDDLVRAVLDQTSVARLRLSSLEPWDLPRDFWHLWKDERLCPHLHLPLQSGSDAILRRMARRCTVDAFKQLVADARAQIPDLTVTTDIIVGFPGETDDDFAQTVQVCEAIGFAHVHIFSFSAREGTPAARMPDRVPQATIKQRSRDLHQVTANCRAQVLQCYVGSTQPVLWEQATDLNNGQQRWSGLTRNYLRVHATAPQGVDLTNRITNTRLVGLTEVSANAERDLLGEC